MVDLPLKLAQLISEISDLETKLGLTDMADIICIYLK